MPVANIKSTWKSGDLVFEKYIASANPQIEFGIDGTGLDVKFYGDTASASMLWDESADALVFAGGASAEFSQTTGTSGKNGIKITNVFSLATAGVHKGIQSDVTYTPATSGIATTIAIAGKAALAAGKTFGTGSQGLMWGLQGQMDFGSSSVVNQASSIFAGVRGVLTSTATPTFTEAEGISCYYADNLIAQDMDGLSTGFSSFFYGNNSGGNMNCAIYLRGGNKVANLFRFETVGTMVSANAETGGTSKKIACDFEGETHYINMYTG